MQTNTCPKACAACDRPWRFLYLTEDCAYNCPIMGAVAAQPFRVRGKSWDYFSTTTSLLHAGELMAFRQGMLERGPAICGDRNCSPNDMAPIELGRVEARGYLDRHDGKYELDTMALSLTDYCKGGCRICFQRCDVKDVISVPQFVLDDLAANLRVRKVFLMGGEVFHLPHEQVERALDWATTLGGSIGVTTAGDGVLGKFLSRYKWGELRFSVDAASRSLHKFLRPGINYDLLWENLTEAARLYSSRVVVLVTASAHNAPELPDLVDKLASIVSRIRINMSFKGGRASEDSLLDSRPDLLAELAYTLPPRIHAAEQQGVRIEWPRLQTMLSDLT